MNTTLRLFMFGIGIMLSACMTSPEDDVTDTEDPASIDDETSARPEEGAAYAISRVRVYINSFETGDDLDNWERWHNCEAVSWPAKSHIYRESERNAPAGDRVLRLETSRFKARCAYPGAYALSPKIAARGGRLYMVENYSRNGRSAGVTGLFFYDQHDRVIYGWSNEWAKDAWKFGQDTYFGGCAPRGTTHIRVRYHLSSPSAVADMDLLKVFDETNKDNICG